MSQNHLGLFDTPADQRQIRSSLAVVGLLYAALIFILPVRDIRLGEVDAFIPTIDGIMFVGELITASLLYAQAAVFRSRALTVLATAYIFGALLLIPHALTFPGAFAPDGLLGAGVNTTAWIYFLRQLGFPIATILYVRLKQADSAAQPGTKPRSARIGVGLSAGVVLAAAATLLVTIGQDLLPPFFINRADMIYSHAAVYESVMAALYLAATVVLLRQPKSVLDVWLLVAFAGWLFQSFLLVVIHGRFTAGWYCLFGTTLFSHLVVLVALIVESNRLYARLALATSARDRDHDARLMSIDAMAAAIAHEVGQPLAAVGAHARAGLNWLDRAEPDAEKGKTSVLAVIDAARRTTEVVKSLRATFARRPGVRTDFSLNDLVRATVLLLDRELIDAKVSVRFALDDGLRPIRADQTRIQQVLVNLLINAIQSVSAVQGRPRRIAIRTAVLDDQDLLVEVGDNGAGISPEDMPRIFESFFTTKTTGAGMGLWLCRTIVEAYGGHLWASHGESHGATFHLQLPRGESLAV